MGGARACTGELGWWEKLAVCSRIVDDASSGDCLVLCAALAHRADARARPGDLRGALADLDTALGADPAHPDALLSKDAAEKCSRTPALIYILSTREERPAGFRRQGARVCAVELGWRRWTNLTDGARVAADGRDSGGARGRRTRSSISEPCFSFRCVVAVSFVGRRGWNSKTGYWVRVICWRAFLCPLIPTFGLGAERVICWR